MGEAALAVKVLGSLGFCCEALPELGLVGLRPEHAANKSNGKRVNRINGYLEDNFIVASLLSQSSAAVKVELSSGLVKIQDPFSIAGASIANHLPLRT